MPNTNSITIPIPKASVFSMFPGGAIVGIGVDVGKGADVGFSTNVGLLQHNDTDGVCLQALSKEGNAQYPCPPVPVAHICPVSQF